MEALKNKKAVVTGGSRGIGKEIAAAYLREGAQVFLIARNAGELSGVHEELAQLGVVHTAAADVSKADDMKHVAEEIGRLWGSIDILVNAAGVYGPIGNVMDADPEEWHKALDVNLFGTFAATHYFAPLMKAQKSGSIINFVGGGEGAYPNFSSYVSAKGGIARFTETAAAELGALGITVNAIAPGAVNTKFLEDVLTAGPEKAGTENYEKSLKQKESGGVSPAQAAMLCVFLASDEAKGITGKILSAVWDPYEKLPEHIAEIAKSDVYTTRRILPKDRGFDWGEK